MRRRRVAPSAARIVSSRCRVVARASSRLATFAHAISRTNDTAASRTSAASFTPRTTWSRSGTSRNRRPVLNRGYFAASPAADVSASARAWPSVTPSFRRPSTPIDRAPRAKRRPSNGSAPSGIHRSVAAGKVRNEKPAGNTPTTCTARPSSVSVAPTASAAPAKRRCHRRVADERDGRSARTLFRGASASARARAGRRARRRNFP